jgi:hypothetical protein
MPLIYLRLRYHIVLLTVEKLVLKKLMQETNYGWILPLYTVSYKFFNFSIICLFFESNNCCVYRGGSSSISTSSSILSYLSNKYFAASFSDPELLMRTFSFNSFGLGKLYFFSKSEGSK